MQFLSPSGLQVHGLLHDARCGQLELQLPGCQIQPAHDLWRQAGQPLPLLSRGTSAKSLPRLQHTGGSPA